MKAALEWRDDSVDLLLQEVVVEEEGVVAQLFLLKVRHSLAETSQLCYPV
jgi:hypothetical protein